MHDDLAGLMTPSGLRGVLNDAVSIFFLDATLASFFVARWCAGNRVETAGGVFQVREDEVALGSEQGCIGRRNVKHALCPRGGSILRMPEQVRLSASRNASLNADGYRLCRNRQPSFRQDLIPPTAPRDEGLRRASADWLCRPSGAARARSENGQPNTVLRR